MGKLGLRPLRLIRIETGPLEKVFPFLADPNTMKVGNETKNDSIESNSTLTEEKPIISDNNTMETVPPRGDAAAQSLLKRTPNSYLLNQAYGLWFLLTWYMLTAVITHNVSQADYGVMAVVLTTYNTILYIISLGLEDATTTYIPRVFSEHGPASASLLIRRILSLRLVVLVISVIFILLCLPVLAALISMTGIKGSSAIATGLRNPDLLSHVTPVAVYIFGSSIGSLLTALCAALMRMKIVFYIGSITNVAMLGVGIAVIQLGWGVNGILWMLAIVSLFNAAAFVIWLLPFLWQRGAEYKQPLGPVVRLGISAWLTNIVTGALLKQTTLIMLGIFAVSIVDIGYFNLSFQLADAANILLAYGFGGVAGSALASAFVGHNNERLSRTWQSLIKVETLLAAPGLVFCLFNSTNIANALYGSKFDPVGPLLGIFLFFNIFVRVFGTTIHQSTLYVVGKAKLVVLGQWLSMLVLIVLGTFLIGYMRLGPAGALIADGLAKALTGGVLLAFLWKDLPHKYPLGYTLRFLLALVLAALPSLLWHPSNQLLLFVSGIIFLVLCFGLLLWIKPLDEDDIEMIKGINPKIAKYLHYFARKHKK